MKHLEHIRLKHQKHDIAGGDGLSCGELHSQQVTLECSGERGYGGRRAAQCSGERKDGARKVPGYTAAVVADHAGEGRGRLVSCSRQGAPALENVVTSSPTLEKARGRRCGGIYHGG
jgi:hypothetical protein